MESTVTVSKGNIAKALADVARAKGGEAHYFVLGEHGRANFIDFVRAHKATRVGVCISNKDSGEDELGYLMEILMKTGLPVATCGKCAIAHHGSVLQPYRHRFGYSGACGGGSGIVPELEWRSASWDGRKVEFFASVNGSFNKLGAYAEARRHSILETAEIAAKEAVEDKCAEPGVVDGESFLREERKDIMRKVCVLLWVITGGNSKLTPDLLQDITGRPLENVRDPCRFIVSFRNYEDEEVKEPEVLDGGFRGCWGSWRIVGGWRRKDDLHEGGAWLPADVGNAVRLWEEGVDLPSIYSGAGAGPLATATAMWNDLERLSRR